MTTRFLRKLRPWFAGLALAVAAPQLRAVDYHVATPQQLQNALTLAAASSVTNNIYVTNGYYLGNFNFNSTNVNSLTLLAESNVGNSQIIIDSGGIGIPMSITGPASPNITVQGMTFLRNCGSTSLGGLQIAGGNTAILVNGCSFLSPTNSSGAGLLIVSGINATVTNCLAAGSAIGVGGAGISISGVINNVTVQNCTLTTNFGEPVGGLGVVESGIILVTGSLFEGNSGDTVAGAYCDGTTVTLSGNTFIGNTAGLPGGYGLGGGANCFGTTVTISSNTFAGNLAGFSGSYGSGGGAFCSGTTVSISGNKFTGNSTVGVYGYGSPPGGGGGIYCFGTTVTLSGNDFTDNSTLAPPAAYYSLGGGAYCSGNVTLSNNTFTGNSSGNIGGGAYCFSSVTNPISVCGNTFQLNTAISGGGLYATGPMISLLDNLVVNNGGNSTSSQGGGIWVDASASLNMIDNTVTGNTSAGSGGGVAYLVTGTVELLNVYNNIIWGNLATVNGGDVWLSGTGQQKLFNFNDVDSMYGVWDVATNNIDLAPQFFDPVNGDYHIQGTSPCKAVGSTNAPSLPATDLDGNPRIVNGTVDLGCYEFITTVPHPADTNGDFIISAAEFNAYAAAWQTGQIWTNGPNPGPNPITANYLTRAGYLMTNNGGAYTNDGSARPVNWKTVP